MLRSKSSSVAAAQTALASDPGPGSLGSAPAFGPAPGPTPGPDPGSATTFRTISTEPAPVLKPWQHDLQR